jgi:tRNA G18 (ribose-2'-O)-methylase SpoU
VIEPVESVGDPRIADYAQVGDPGWLRDRGFFVAEGRLVVRRLLEGGRFPLHSILLTPAALRSFGAKLEIDAPVYVAGQDVLDGIAGFNFHRGCVALARRPTDEHSSERFFAANLLLAIEGVGNPDNVGGLFRVAAAFGVNGVLLDPTTGDPFYRKAVRTSMGAVLNLPFARATPWPDVLDHFRKAGFTIVALTPAPDARLLSNFAAKKHAALLLMVGSEGTGLSQPAQAAADVRVRIPIAEGVDSLNVAVAAGIALSRLTG